MARGDASDPDFLKTYPDETDVSDQDPFDPACQLTFWSVSKGFAPATSESNE
jgi:hypothetical protein